MRKGLVASLDSVLTIPGRSVSYGAQYSQVSNDSESQSQGSSRPGYSQPHQSSFDRFQYQDSESQSSQQMREPCYGKSNQNRTSHHQVVDTQKQYWRKPNPSNFPERNQPKPVPHNNKDFIPYNNIGKNKVTPKVDKEKFSREFEKKVELEIQNLRSNQEVLSEKMDENISTLNRVVHQLEELSSFLSQPSSQLSIITDRIDSMSRDIIESRKSSETRLEQLETVQLESRNLLQIVSSKTQQYVQEKANPDHKKHQQDVSHKHNEKLEPTQSLEHLNHHHLNKDVEIDDDVEDEEVEESEENDDAMSQPIIPQSETAPGSKSTVLQREVFDMSTSKSATKQQGKPSTSLNNITPPQQQVNQAYVNSSDEENEAESLDLMEWMKQKSVKSKNSNSKKKNSAGKRKQQVDIPAGAPSQQSKRMTVVTNPDSCSLFNDSIDVVGREIDYSQEDAQQSSFRFTTSSLSQGY